jgi:hypothetical protein
MFATLEPRLSLWCFIIVGFTITEEKTQKEQSPALHASVYYHTKEKRNKGCRSGLRTFSSL